MLSHADAFLQAIIEAPDDDAPRLVYADWLEESDPTRAEFIRVQCKLEKTPRHEPRPTREETKKCPCPWCILKCRARILCHEGYPEPGWVWAGAPLNQIPDAEYSFRRGFVDEVTLTAALWLAHADALTAAAPIREVRLTTWPEYVHSGGARLSGRGKHQRCYRLIKGETLEALRVASEADGVWLHLNATRESVVRALLAAEWTRVKTWNLPA